ncbi:IS3 family transposase [Bacillus chungangensis]|uniref:HTH-like domain-containing protein n=1 Tax=Bacillus chungangensis TaxID=587633 RepID=A0ABT9WZL1_9BACI|nr:IS3 family transposase [Bacillus chungangensis]MDQ0178549.1 hypothetical protein [Bacillus chungangensis]
MNRPEPDKALKETIKAIYDEHEGRYGYRRIRNEFGEPWSKSES